MPTTIATEDNSTMSPIVKPSGYAPPTYPEMLPQRDGLSCGVGGHAWTPAAALLASYTATLSPCGGWFVMGPADLSNLNSKIQWGVLESGVASIELAHAIPPGVAT